MLKYFILILSIISCKHYESNQNISIINHTEDTTSVNIEVFENIAGSKWTKKPFGDQCVDYLEFFKNDTFSFGCNCGVLDSTFGKWKFIKDTLILEEIGSYYSNDINEEIDKMKWKAILKNDTIIFKYGYRWNHLNNKFYNTPNILDEKFNLFIRK